MKFNNYSVDRNTLQILNSKYTITVGSREPVAHCTAQNFSTRQISPPYADQKSNLRTDRFLSQFNFLSRDKRITPYTTYHDNNTWASSKRCNSSKSFIP